jgi:hypothetical protein
MSERPIYPAFVFFRRHDIELESGLLLAGQLIVDFAASEEPTRRQQQMVREMVQQLTDHAQSGRMPNDAQVIGWRDGRKPANAVDVDDDALMTAWAKDRLIIAVRVDPRNDGLMRIDSDMRRQAGLPDHATTIPVDAFQEPAWSSDIAPSLEALCRRMSKEAERIFDREGELPLMFLIEAPGKGQAKIDADLCASEDEKVERYKNIRRDFARWGVTRYACAAESWMGGNEGLRPSEDPERREIVTVGATDGRECLSGIRAIHRPQQGKPSLGKLELHAEGESSGRLFNLLRPRTSDELPDDEGTVFMTNVPDSSIQAMGRRDPTTGELCVGTIFKVDDRRADASPLDEITREAKHWGCEIVSGPEAENLIRRIQLTDRRAANLQ